MTSNEITFKNLRAEMARAGLSGNKISLGIGISSKSFGYKLQGKTEFTRSEMIKIRELFFNHVGCEYLFDLNN